MTTSKEPIYYINGKFLPKSDAKIHVMDLGWVRGYGVFDFLITYSGGNPFRLSDHISRLFNSSSFIGLKLPWPKKYLKEVVLRTLAKNKNGGEKSIRIVATGGVSLDSITPPKNPTLAIFVEDLKRYPDAYYSQGVKIITVGHKRFIPEAKTINYIFAIKALEEAKKKGAIEAVYYDSLDNTLYEGSTSNIFIVEKGKLLTPKVDLLPGITRQVVLELFPQTKVTSFSKDRLYSAQEAFLTASNKEIMPVVKVDNKIIGDGKVGPITKKVIEEFRKYTQNGKW